MLNTISIMGRLTKDPELRKTPNDISVTSFTLAVDRDYSTGEEKVTDFIPVVAWRHTAEFVSKYFKKGNMAVASGRLQVRSYDKDGEKRTIAEVLANEVYFGQAKTTQSSEPAQQSWSDEPDDAELPF